MNSASPFQNDEKLYLVYGNTHDQFCTPALQLLGFEEYLCLHLTEAGFDNVVFFSPSKKIYFRDETSYINYQKASGAILDTAEDISGAVETNVLAPGPMGRVVLKNPAAADDNASSAVASRSANSWRILEQDASLPGLLDAILNDISQKTAFVFSNYEDVRSGFSEATERLIKANIDSFRTENSQHNKNICIFVSHAQGLGAPREDRNPRDFHSRYYDVFFNRQGAPRKSAVRIGSPEADEISHLVQRQRIIGEKNKVCLSELEAHSTDIARMIAENKDDEGTKLEPQGRKLLAQTDLRTAISRETGLQKLETMIGRSREVKEIKKIINLARYDTAQLDAQAGKKMVPMNSQVRRLLPEQFKSLNAGVNLSLALEGNTGTGKTMMARLIGEAYRDAGLLRSGHFIEVSSEDLVAGFIGQTAIKTREVLERALGGTLFIDEVQKFKKAGGANNASYDEEAIQTIMKFTEDHRGEIAVIVATYPGKMEKFFEMDEGLRRRFSIAITLDDYGAQELSDIAIKIAKANGLSFNEDVQRGLANMFDNWRYEPSKDKFANGGAAQTFVEDCRKKLNAADPDLNLLTRDMLPTKYMEHFTKTRKLDTPQAALEHLDGLVGLSDIRRTLSQIIDTIQGAKAANLDVQNVIPYSYAFLGKPGTGKTTVAEILGKIYLALGLVNTDVPLVITRKDIVSDRPDGMAKNMEEALVAAKGRVLFLDEAHQFASDVEGRKAIQAIMPYLEQADLRQNQVIVLAGYPEAMGELWDGDGGLAGRISQHITFRDFSDTEMTEIFQRFAANGNLSLAKNATSILTKELGRLRGIEREKFANARSVRNFFEQVYRRRMARFHREVEQGEFDKIIDREDINLSGDTGDVLASSAAEQLDALIGLNKAKAVIQGYVNSVQVSNARGTPPRGPDHFVFTGNPGTGKTTVARLFGEIMKDLGLLNSGHTEEVSRQDLVGRYKGATEDNVKARVNAALDGVLFVDEAHNLRSGGEGDWGELAIKTLVNLIENHRDRLSVILAGYPTEMKHLISADPGLSSRFTKYVHFEDYSAPECSNIFRLLASNPQDPLEVDPALDEALDVIFERLIKHEGTNYSNGRSVRNLLRLMDENLATRIVNQGLIAGVEASPALKNSLITLTAEDVPVHLQRNS